MEMLVQEIIYIAVLLFVGSGFAFFYAYFTRESKKIASTDKEEISYCVKFHGERLIGDEIFLGQNEKFSFGFSDRKKANSCTLNLWDAKIQMKEEILRDKQEELEEEFSNWLMIRRRNNSQINIAPFYIDSDYGKKTLFYKKNNSLETLTEDTGRDFDRIAEYDPEDHCFRLTICSEENFHKGVLVELTHYIR